MRAWRLGIASFLALSAAIAPSHSIAKTRTVGFTRAVFRMEEGATWGRISGGANCDVDLERLQWGREGSDIRTDRLGTIFRQAMADTGGTPEENLFDDAPVSTDLQVAAAISEMRANICEQPGLYGYRGSLSMAVQWQVYDPSVRQIVGRFETQATGQSTQNMRNGLDDLFMAAFRANARDLTSDSRFERLLRAPAAPPGGAALPVTTRETIKFSAESGTAAHPLPQTVQSVVLVLTSGGHGSGFLISREGYVLTNHHVVGNSSSVRIRWADGIEEPGQVVRFDPKRDVALVKVAAPGRAALALHAALPSQGDTVFAVGAPLDPGLQGTLTSGIVSANRVEGDQPFIQSDVAVTHGNSGGPLLNRRGEVIGLTVAGRMENGVPVGLNMFIPIADALRALALEPAAAPAGGAPSPLAKPRNGGR